MTEPDPSQIMQLGMGFLASKTLLSAVELGLFTELARRPMTAPEIGQALGLSPRAVPDFPDALVALKVLERRGDGPEARYSNTAEGALFLDRNGPAYVGGLLEMANARLFRHWADLTEGLKTGLAQNEVKHTGTSIFETLYASPELLEQFLNAMAGASFGNVRALAAKFDFSRYKTLCDVGGATALLACTVAAAHPHLACSSFDLPPVAPIAQKRIDKAGLADRVAVASGDFFAGPLPKADVITMGMILHDWNLEKKKLLIRKAYEALPKGGAFVVIEALIDDARRENAFGLLMSLNMLMETGEGFDYSGADFAGWCREAGFRRFEVIPLAGPSSAAVAYK
ncbi:Ubiquinone/menaquinone biosynthesis C-methylase UbiE [Tistlia consotensis]|uniref:Ubiquinone/menaquinone biosynthesis C-methylase UbiE n=1 Tax=Tistlia consotensis USBA 355 TaxID=560819 RepID=A0A1Y6CJ79_9PROT|nr:methyltransferase [Tistlia consotensis]SMF65655.1 Ubiquinone/menaquinone biosynthesis C-methylase UbiE [Tistlia consotensis USBA 355]SNS03403.1 Ubiquinone/menaquinone biosynthesis C-methylase UbiE [Tistlia consotensis]